MTASLDLIVLHEHPEWQKPFNANSNLRPSVAAAWGFDPFERVVDFLVDQRRNA